MGLPSDDDATKARLDALSTALDARQKSTPARGDASPTEGPAGIGQAVSLGFRVMSEFVAAIVVAGVIGWAIDRALGSSPVGLILLIGLGTAAGFWNIYRMAANPPRPGGGR